MDEQVVQTKKPRAKYEWLIIAVVLVAAIVIAFGIHARRDATIKGKLLITELENIRSAVAMYKTMNRTNPTKLEALTKLNYSFVPGESAKPYLNNVRTNTKGELVDPFGATYRYDTKTGWVVSGTKAYEKW